MEEERLRVRQEELARLRVEFAMSVAAEGPAAEGAEGADEEGDVGAPDGVVAVLDGESGGPAEVQNEVPENAMEPEAKDFDPEAFLSVRGYESVAAPTGEVNGDGSPGPVDVPEVVVAEPEVSEPEGVQEIPGTGGGDFDDAGFGPVDEKVVPLPPSYGGDVVGPGADVGDAEELGAVVADEPVAAEVVAGGGRWRPSGRM